MKQVAACKARNPLISDVVFVVLFVGVVSASHHPLFLVVGLDLAKRMSKTDAIVKNCLGVILDVFAVCTMTFFYFYRLGFRDMRTGRRCATNFEIQRSKTHLFWHPHNLVCATTKTDLSLPPWET